MKKTQVEIVTTTPGLEQSDAIVCARMALGTGCSWGKQELAPAGLRSILGDDSHFQLGQLLGCSARVVPFGSEIVRNVHLILKATEHLQFMFSEKTAVSSISKPNFKVI